MVPAPCSGPRGAAPLDSERHPARLAFLRQLLKEANAFEAFFQALWNRTWIEGTFTFGYTYAEIPLVVDASTRGNPAEGVLSKYYGVLPSG